nr:FxDxF family PEP-CTERM protein [Roseateles sp. DAIF2]
MKLKSLVAASLVAFASLGAQAASAAFSDTVTEWNAHDLHESSGLKIVDSSTLFFSQFNFTLSTESFVSSNVSAFNINSGSYSIFKADGSETGHSWTFGAAQGLEHLVTLGPGSYYFSVAGKTNGSSGIYALSSAATAVPVPEPETYALLLAGLGVVGFVARRRKQA